MQREDPSLRVRYDPESAQTILEGMGELHIEVVKDRLKVEHGLDVFLGKLQVNYRETISAIATASVELEEFLQNKRQHVFITLSVRPKPLGGRPGPVKFNTDAESVTSMAKWVAEAVARGCADGVEAGPLLGFPLRDVTLRLEDVRTFPGVTANVIAACATQALSKAVLKAGPQLLEPMIKLEVKLPEQHQQSLLDDLAARRANIDSIDRDHDLEFSVVRSTAPLATLTGFASSLRHLSSGLARMHLEPAGYRTLGEGELEALRHGV